MVSCGDGPVGIIAGGQDLPFEVINALQAAGRPYFIFGIVGEADARIESHPHHWIKWGEIGLLFKLLEQNALSELLCIGSIRSRPDFSSIRLDLGAMKALPAILRIMASGGDEGVLQGVAGFFEKRGVRLVSVPEVAPGLVVGPDLCVGNKAAEANESDIALAARAAGLIGALDAGQGVVVAAGRILAMEGPEGTDQMLARVLQIRQEKRARWNEGKQGVLLKRARPGQDLRFDMPTIGPRTIENAHKAGLAGIVCAEGEVLCANRAQSLEMAHAAGLFLVSRKLEDFSL
ncbi:UDP-2,3-diacylglucosamine diphosphatase LpxI domain-containing protein [uncultured Cohaesibacter sp.]|uniref:LpxI family protein n=1 Tax=uncultured Cohaesibacter sp. TaxID=1002546 RepID=UPI002AAC2CFF|nr:UDP-2,3-diacylglucosamine diphosphatase LpxI [uncultured Cohaesibacter sp.]